MDKLIVAFVPELVKVIPYTLAVMLAFWFGWVIVANLIKRFKVTEDGAKSAALVPALQTQISALKIKEADHSMRIEALTNEQRELVNASQRFVTQDNLRIALNDAQNIQRMAAGESNTKLWNAIRELETVNTVKAAIEKDRDGR